MGCAKEELQSILFKWKVEGSQFNEERKKSYPEVATIYSKKESSIWAIVKNKGTHTGFAVATQTAEF